ncbi:MAG: DUF4307 domain-containing protein [Aeromicrobium erythreum]
MTDLADRYGTRRRPRWVWWVVAAVGVSFGVAWAAWIAFQPRPVTATVYGYDVRSDTSTVVKLDVRRSDDDPRPLHRLRAGRRPRRRGRADGRRPAQWPHRHSGPDPRRDGASRRQRHPAHV